MRELLNEVYEEIQSSGLNSKVRVQGILDLLKTTVDSTYARPYQKYPKIRAFLTSSFGQDSLAAVLARSTFRMTREEYAEVQKKGRERTIQREPSTTKRPFLIYYARQGVSAVSNLRPQREFFCRDWRFARRRSYPDDDLAPM